MFYDVVFFRPASVIVRLLADGTYVVVKPPGVTIQALTGTPPEDQSAEVDALTAEVARLTTELDACVNPPPVLNPSIVGFAAVPSSLPAGGGSVTLNATVTDAVSLTMNGAPVTLPFTTAVPLTTTYTLVATGAAGTTPAQAQVSVTVAVVVPPPPAGALVWSRLDVGDTGTFGAYFRRPCVHRGTGDVWAAWGKNNPADPAGTHPGSKWFRQSSKTWTPTAALGGPRWDVGMRENYGAAHDPDHSAIWIGFGSVISYGEPPDTVTPQYGDLTFDIATNEYALKFPAQGGQAIGREQGAFLYWQNAIYSFGGWQGSRMVKRTLPSGPIVDINGSVTPPWSTQTSYGGTQQEAAKMTSPRSGLNGSIAWTLANDNELWTFDLATAGPWVHVVTTGTKPPYLGIVAGLHEARQQIVAWCGRPGLVTDDAGPVVRSTWYLDLATKVWTMGPNAAAGDAVPISCVQSLANLLYDPVGEQMLLVIDSSGNGFAQVWTLRGSL